MPGSLAPVDKGTKRVVSKAESRARLLLKASVLGGSPRLIKRSYRKGGDREGII